MARVRRWFGGRVAISGQASQDAKVGRQAWLADARPGVAGGA